MRKTISIIIISIIFLLILSIFTYKQNIEKYSILSENKLDNIITVDKAENRCTNLLETFKTGIYKIYITDVMDDKCYFDYSYLRIFKDGKLIIEDSYPYKLYSDYPRHINKYIINVDEDYKFNWEWKGNSIPPDYDVTGDKSPNLVIETYSLGAHCCFSYLIYDVGEKPHLVTELDTYHSEYNSFYKFPNYPGLNIKTEDWSYAYWNAPYVASPAPEIYLKFNNITNKYELNISKMKKAVPDKDILNNWKKEVKENWTDNPNILWKYMLQLTYTGNWGAAIKFMDSAWPKGEYMYVYTNEKFSKRKFLRELISVIRGSRYADGILKLNNDLIKINWRI
tara:strand:- start:66 stop:1079 length:1014 start_codon:yes stop_codon:yes gene_type:complete